MPVARSPSWRPPSATLIAIAAMLLAAGTARADVIEIDAAGSAHVRTASGAVQWLTAPLDEPSSDVAFPAAALTTTEGIRPPPTFARALVRAADTAGISPALLEAVVWQESRWRPNALSPAGARGLGQLMPGTARDLGVDPRDPEANLIGSATYLRGLLTRFNDNIEQALAAYNAGPARVRQAGGIPNIAETRAYVAQITARLGSTVRQP